MHGALTFTASSPNLLRAYSTRPRIPFRSDGGQHSPDMADIEAAPKAGVISHTAACRRRCWTPPCNPRRSRTRPTAACSLNRASEQLVAAAQKAGVALRQSYARVGKSS